MATYETSATLESFRGLMEDGDGRNLSLKYAVQCDNCETTGGYLQPMKDGAPAFTTLPAPIGTLATLYRRYHPTDAEKEVLVAVAGGKLYVKHLGYTDAWVEKKTGLLSDVFDYVAYEKTQDGDDAPTDILLLSNARDGMLCLWGDDLRVTEVATPYKFGVLARHAERIWGSGITDAPDTLCYCTPYDPFDWEQNNDSPADGGGEILQPSWDGDSFVALRTYGQYLLCFKRQRVWCVMGLNPGEYYLKEQFGGGVTAENTACVDGSKVYMLGDEGLLVYDGLEVQPFRQQAVRLTYDRVTRAAAQNACACLYKGKLLLALPVDGSVRNNLVLEYRVSDQSFNVRTGLTVKALLPCRDQLLYTSDETPGQVYRYGAGRTMACEWISGWQDLGAKNVQKSNFVIYLTAGTDGGACQLTIGIETERKYKSKLVLLRDGVPRRVSISNRGRWFRLRIASEPDEQYALHGGVQMMMETDHD